jgi:dTDP-glucose 4,6-dehydratase
MTKNIIVTGGLGFIGSNLVRKLCKSNHFVIIIDKNTYSGNKNNLSGIPKKKYKIFQFDIINKKKFEKVLFSYKPIGIFNLAAETHVDRSIDDPSDFIKSNIVGVYSILEAFKKFLSKKKIKSKLIHISTDEVYGDIKKGTFSRESDAYKPSSPYAASKASSDHLVKSYCRTYKLPLIITNCSNNYGPRQFPEKLIPKLITNILNNEDLPIYGNGKNEREWIHVEDHCDALIKVLKSGKSNENYNIGSGEVLNNIKIAKLIINYLKNTKKIKTISQINFVKDRPGHDVRYALNSSKIKIKLRWKKKYNIKKGLAQTIDWYLNNTKWISQLNKKRYKERLGLK